MFYIHLTKKEWSNSWISGGKIPLSMASKYLSVERVNIMTPDETVHRDFSDTLSYKNFTKALDFKDTIEAIDAKDIKFYGKVNPNLKVIEFGPGVTNISLEDIQFIYEKDAELSEYGDFNQNIEDALILSFTTDSSLRQSIRLEKECCIKISSLHSLKTCIDKQLNVIGKFDKCYYTKKMKRNHFLKSSQDSWQKEYRIVWTVSSHFVHGLQDKTFWVDVPANSGKLIDLK